LNSKKILLWFFVLSVLISVNGCASDEITLQAEQLIAYQDGKYSDLEVSGELVNGIREINVAATRFFWDPKVVVVNQQETVRLTVDAIDIPHGFEIEGFTIPEFDSSTVIEPGKPLTIEFVADKQGAWEVICSIYCGAGHKSMKGMFVIK
jgi:cytochrome c oxidase subunit II